MSAWETVESLARGYSGPAWTIGCIWLGAGAYATGTWIGARLRAWQRERVGLGARVCELETRLERVLDAVHAMGRRIDSARETRCNNACTGDGTRQCPGTLEAHGIRACYRTYPHDGPCLCAPCAGTCPKCHESPCLCALEHSHGDD